MFERLWRGDARAAPTAREQLTTADLQGRAILVEAIARMDERLTYLEESPPLPTRDEAEIEAWQSAVAQSSNDIAQGLEQLADVCEQISERLEEHRVDSQALRAAIALLAPSVPRSLDQPAPDQLTSPIAAAHAETSLVEEDEIDSEDDRQDDEISLVDEDADDVISLADEHEVDDASLDDSVDHNDSQAAHTILEQLTEVLNRRSDPEALKLSTRLRRLSTSQWARLRERGEDG